MDLSGTKVMTYRGVIGSLLPDSNTAILPVQSARLEFHILSMKDSSNKFAHENSKKMYEEYVPCYTHMAAY